MSLTTTFTDLKDNTCINKIPHGFRMLSETNVANGIQQHFVYQSSSLNSAIKNSVYIPNRISNGNAKFPVLLFLPGVGSNELSIFTETRCAQLASEYKFIVVSTNRIPERKTQIQEALLPNNKTTLSGDRMLDTLFYLDALVEPWSKNYKMYTYITKELPDLIKAKFPTNGNIGIIGHSMGGHGALVCGLRNPQTFQSISTYAPATNPLSWGQYGIFKRFLGDENKELWQNYDSCSLAKTYSGPFRDILLQQGQEDPFLGTICNPYPLSQATKSNPHGTETISVNIQLLPGFDHSYKIINATLEHHFQHHSKYLKKEDNS